MKNRAGPLITILMGGLTILLWAFINKSQIEPPWPERVQGFCFSPMRGAQSPTPGQFPSIEEIDQDLALLEGKAYAVRTYSVESTLAEVPRLAAGHQLNVTLGAWINRNETENEEQIEKLIDVFKKNNATVVRVIVGNEVLLRTDQTLEQMI